MEDKKQAEQVIRDYLNYLDKQNYEDEIQGLSLAAKELMESGY